MVVVGAGIAYLSEDAAENLLDTVASASANAVFTVWYELRNNLSQRYKVRRANRLSTSHVLAVPLQKYPRSTALAALQTRLNATNEGRHITDVSSVSRS